MFWPEPPITYSCRAGSYNTEPACRTRPTSACASNTPSERCTTRIAERSPNTASILDAIMDLNQPVFEAFHGAQLEAHLPVAPCNQRNALSNEPGSHADHELVDDVLVETGGDKVAAAHQPDILAGLLAQTTNERADRLAHEFDTCRRVRWGRVTREDDRPILPVELGTELHALVVGFPAQQHRVDRFHEGVH